MEPHIRKLFSGIRDLLDEMLDEQAEVEAEADVEMLDEQAEAAPRRRSTAWKLAEVEAEEEAEVEEEATQEKVETATPAKAKAGKLAIKFGEADIDSMGKTALRDFLEENDLQKHIAKYDAVKKQVVELRKAVKATFILTEPILAAEPESESESESEPQLQLELPEVKAAPPAPPPAASAARAAAAPPAAVPPAAVPPKAAVAVNGGIEARVAAFKAHVESISDNGPHNWWTQNQSTQAQELSGFFAASREDLNDEVKTYFGKLSCGGECVKCPHGPGQISFCYAIFDDGATEFSYPDAAQGNYFQVRAYPIDNVDQATGTATLVHFPK